MKAGGLSLPTSHQGCWCRAWKDDGRPHPFPAESGYSARRLRRVPRDGAGSKGRTGRPVLKHGPITADAEKGRSRPCTEQVMRKRGPAGRPSGPRRDVRRDRRGCRHGDSQPGAAVAHVVCFVQGTVPVELQRIFAPHGARYGSPGRQAWVAEARTCRQAHRAAQGRSAAIVEAAGMGTLNPEPPSPTWSVSCRALRPWNSSGSSPRRGALW